MEYVTFLVGGPGEKIIEDMVISFVWTLCDDCLFSKGSGDELRKYIFFAIPAIQSDSFPVNTFEQPLPVPFHFLCSSPDR